MDEVAESGKQIVITKNGRPVSRLAPYRIAPARQFGIDRGRLPGGGTTAAPSTSTAANGRSNAPAKRALKVVAGGGIDTAVAWVADERVRRASGSDERIRSETRAQAQSGSTVTSLMTTVDSRRMLEATYSGVSVSTGTLPPSTA